MRESLRLAADLSRRNLSLQGKIKDYPFLRKGNTIQEELHTLKFHFSWEDQQTVSSRLFDRHQADKVTSSTLEQLTEGNGSTVDSLFLRMMMSQGRQQLSGDSSDLLFSVPRWQRPITIGVECVIDIYRDPLH